jgi:hypothetical protein
MANEERDALDALEKEAKEYDKVRELDLCVFDCFLNATVGCRD